MKKQFSRYALIFSAALALLWLGCINPTIKELKSVKELHDKGEFQQLANRPINCDLAKEGCNQIHLVKADACYRLAKKAESEDNGAVAKSNYQCAASNFEPGIHATKDWPAEIGARAQYYENWCESLRQWQDSESGVKADSLTQVLSTTAKEFRAKESEHLAAIYFQNVADFAKLRPELLDLTNPSQTCSKLKSIRSDLETAKPRAAGTKYQPNFERIIMDLSGAMSAVPSCQ